MLKKSISMLEKYCIHLTFILRLHATNLRGKNIKTFICCTNPQEYKNLGLSFEASCIWFLFGIIVLFWMIPIMNGGIFDALKVRVLISKLRPCSGSMNRIQYNHCNICKRRFSDGKHEKEANDTSHQFIINKILPNIYEPPCLVHETQLENV